MTIYACEITALRNATIYVLSAGAPILQLWTGRSRWDARCLFKYGFRRGTNELIEQKSRIQGAVITAMSIGVWNTGNVITQRQKPRNWFCLVKDWALAGAVVASEKVIDFTLHSFGRRRWRCAHCCLFQCPTVQNNQICIIEPFVFLVIVPWALTGLKTHNKRKGPWGVKIGTYIVLLLLSVRQTTLLILLSALQAENTNSILN